MTISCFPTSHPMTRERAVTDWAIGDILSIAFDCLRAHLVTRRPGQLIKRRKLRRGDQDDDGREPYGRTVRQSARRSGRPPGPAHPSRNEKRYHACKRQWPGLSRLSTYLEVGL